MIENLKIQLNANIIQKLRSEDIYPDHMGSVICILIALDKKRIDLLDELDDFNKSKRLILLYKQLELRGFLASEGGKLHFKLTKKGEQIVQFLHQEFNKEGVNIDEVVFEQAAVEQPVKNWVEQYIEMFPDEFQDTERTISERMKLFMNTFPQYDKETILGATRMYIKTQENSPSGHDYTKRSQYFIFKGAGANRTWDLATWCKRYLEKGNKTELDTSFMDTL